MDALEESRNFVVIVSKLEYLNSFWLELEMKTFQHELNEGRKPDANFLMVISDTVEDEIYRTNKNVCIYVTEIVKS